MKTDLLTETRLAVPMTKIMRDQIETHWRTLPGVTSAADYMRKLVQKDLKKDGK